MTAARKRQPPVGFTVHYQDRKTMQVPVVTVSEANRRGHWSKHVRRTKTQRATLALSASSMLAKPALPCAIRLTRIAPRALDTDNLLGALKACRDGIADWLGIDDRDSRVEWKCAQSKGQPREYGVRVEILEAP